MDFIDDFIEEYKSNPCLWKADSVDFRNRIKRQEAYMKLIDVATKHGEIYNVERTKQKINNLRCAFRHQFRKYNEVKKKGEKYEPYCPKRRYFESLMFLKDEEIPEKKLKREDSVQSAESTVAVVQSEACDELSECDSIVKQSKTHITKLSPSNTTTEFNIFEEPEPVTNSIINIQTLHPNNHVIKEVDIILPPNSAITSERRKSIPDPNAYREKFYSKEKQVTTANLTEPSTTLQTLDSKDVSTGTGQGQYIKADISNIDFDRLFSLALKSADNHLDDNFTNFGKLIAHKLRTMEQTQAIYAEKIISDVLYQGQMKMLSTLSIHQFLGVDNATVYLESHK